MNFLDTVGGDNVALQYDVYQMQRMEGNLADAMPAHEIGPAPGD